jgi:hypothetical protein
VPNKSSVVAGVVLSGYVAAVFALVAVVALFGCFGVVGAFAGAG